MRVLAIIALCYFPANGFSQQMNAYQRAEAFGKQVVAAISTGKAEALRNVMLTEGEALILEKDRIKEKGTEYRDKMLQDLKRKREETLEAFRTVFSEAGRNWRGLEYRSVRFSKYTEGKQITADIKITAGVGDTLYSIRAQDCVFFNVNWKAVDDLSFRPVGNYMTQEMIKKELLSSVNPGDRSCKDFVEKEKVQVVEYFVSKTPYKAFNRNHYFGCKIVFESDTSVAFNIYPGRDGHAVHAGEGVYRFSMDAGPRYARDGPFRYTHYSFEYRPFDKKIMEFYVYESDTTVIEYKLFEHRFLGGYLMNYKVLDKEGPVYSVDIVPIRPSEFQLQLQLNVSDALGPELVEKISGCQPSDTGRLRYVGGKWYYQDQHEPRYVPVKLTREGFQFTIEANRFGFLYSMENDFKRIK